MAQDSVYALRLRYLRETLRSRRSITVTSQLIGLGDDTLRRYERGEQEPKGENLKKIAEFYTMMLGCYVSTDYILGRENDQGLPVFGSWK